MTVRGLVYVHGAGPQKPPALAKREVDLVLFGEVVSYSRVAYYADVRWPRESTGSGSGARSSRAAGSTRVGQAIRRSARPDVSPREAANAVVSASLAPSDGGGRRGRAAGPSSPPQTAVDLVEQFYRRADRVARYSAASPGGPERALGILDPIFRLVMGAFASDVAAYLWGPSTEAMRAPVRASLLQAPAPGAIVAHSLGAIIAYDVLAEPALAGLPAPLLVTPGSPLGVGLIQEHLRDDAGLPNPVPAELGAWTNVADPWDPVALDPTIRDEFEPPRGFIRDIRVNNPAPNNHDLTGYLSVAIVRDLILGSVGPA